MNRFTTGRRRRYVGGGPRSHGHGPRSHVHCETSRTTCTTCTRRADVGARAHPLHAYTGSLVHPQACTRTVCEQSKHACRSPLIQPMACMHACIAVPRSFPPLSRLTSPDFWSSPPSPPPPQLTEVHYLEGLGPGKADAALRILGGMGGGARQADKSFAEQVGHAWVTLAGESCMHMGHASR